MWAQSINPYNMDKVYGFEPVYDKDSKLLILGSFPSVKSRKTDFYYGNKQNRFWKTVCSFFGEDIPETREGKIEFLRRRNIALWDIVTECEIEGSKDSTIKNFKIADLEKVLQNSEISFIILNGSTAFEIFYKNYGGTDIEFKKLPSTSPANPTFKSEEWFNVLRRIFG